MLKQMNDKLHLTLLKGRYEKMETLFFFFQNLFPYFSKFIRKNTGIKNDDYEIFKSSLFGIQNCTEIHLLEMKSDNDGYYKMVSKIELI